MSSTSDNPEAPSYHELPDVKAWAEAVRASTHRVRVDAFENHNYALHWFCWLTFGLGWTYEKAWKWIDDNHGEELLGVKTGLLFHESPLWYILHLFVDPEIRRECPRGCHARFMGEIQSAIEMMERRGQERLYQEEFWRKVQSCVTEVTARWRSVGWSIDKINQLHDEKKTKARINCLTDFGHDISVG